MPKTAIHEAKKKKMVNCGVVAFTLERYVRRQHWAGDDSTKILGKVDEAHSSTGLRCWWGVHTRKRAPKCLCQALP